MLRVIITGKNREIPPTAFSTAVIPPGMKPGARNAGELRLVQTGEGTNTVRRSVRAPRPLQSPAPDHPPNAERGTWADWIIEVMTVIGGLAVFGAIALFLLALA